jgi:hypothetical protein
LAVEAEGVVAESSARRKVANPLELDFRRVGLHLKAIKALADVASKRATLPRTRADLEGRKVWTDRRLRSLAVACDLNPPQGSRRKPLLKLIEEFREDLVDLDLDEVQLQDAPPDAADEVGLADEDDDDVARLRALEERDFQTQVEEAEREYAVDFEAAAKRERDEVKEALAAVHTSNMKALQERLGAVKRARTAPSPLLTESRIARMDKGVPRPVAQPVRPGDLRPAAPPPDVERPVRVEAEN